MRKNKTAIIVILCLLLCVSLLPVSAFADQTVVIVGGAVEQGSVVVQPASGNGYSASDPSSSVIVADNRSGNVFTQGQNSSSGVIVIMPDGTTVNTQNVQVQAAPTTETTVSVQQPQNAVFNSNTFLNELFNRINKERTANGLGILGYDNNLQPAADIRAKECAQSFGHTRPDGSAAVTAVTVDYNVAGETLIQVKKAYATVDLLVETWMNSEAHKANILMTEFSQTAFGIYEENGVIYISQIFTD